MVLKTPLPSALVETANGLLKHLSLLFVPAGVGVVQQLDRLGSEGVRLVAVIVLSTAITLAVTALTFAGVARLISGRAKKERPRVRP
jgi:holin-like protein